MLDDMSSVINGVGAECSTVEEIMLFAIPRESTKSFPPETVRVRIG